MYLICNYLKQRETGLCCTKLNRLQKTRENGCLTQVKHPGSPNLLTDYPVAVGGSR